MAHYIFPIICIGPNCADELGQRTMTTTDMLEGWTLTRDRLFSYDGNEVWLCPNCTLRWEARLQRFLGEAAARQQGGEEEG